MAANDTSDPYPSARAALINRLRSLTDDQSKTVVPACPDWTVKDVAAHLSGLVAEALAGVPPPYGSPEATARQVSNRSDNSLAEICDEWEGNGGAFVEYAEENPAFRTALISDLTVHSHDIAEALNSPIEPDSPGLTVATERYLELLQERAAEKLDIALNVDLAGVGSRPASAGTTPLTLAASPVEFLRCVTGRRTRDHIRTLNWTGDPSELIESAFYQYQPAG